MPPVDPEINTFFIEPLLIRHKANRHLDSGPKPSNSEAIRKDHSKPTPLFSTLAMSQAIAAHSSSFRTPVEIIGASDHHIAHSRLPNASSRIRKLEHAITVWYNTHNRQSGQLDQVGHA
jgi:hypothetical protein